MSIMYNKAMYNKAMYNKAMYNKAMYNKAIRDVRYDAHVTSYGIFCPVSLW